MSRVRLTGEVQSLADETSASKSHQPLPAGRSACRDLDRHPHRVAVQDGARVEARRVAVGPASEELEGAAREGLGVGLEGGRPRAIPHAARVLRPRDQAVPGVRIADAGARLEPRDREAAVAREQVRHVGAVLVGRVEFDDDRAPGDVDLGDVHDELPVSGGGEGAVGIGVDEVGVEDVVDVADRNGAGGAVAADAGLDRRHRLAGNAGRAFLPRRTRLAARAVVAVVGAAHRHGDQHR
jgi:hypothetical protein